MAYVFRRPWSDYRRRWRPFYVRSATNTVSVSVGLAITLSSGAAADQVERPALTLPALAAAAAGKGAHG